MSILLPTSSGSHGSYRLLALLAGILIVGGSILSPAARGQAVTEPPAEAVSVDTSAATPDDTAIQRRIEAVFAQIEPLRQVEVDVQSGVVHLTGTVVQRAQAAQAEELATEMEGTLYVINDLETETDVASRLMPAVEKVQGAFEGVVGHLPAAVVALLVVLLFWSASNLLGRWETPPRRLSLSPLVWQLMRRLVQGGIVFVGLLLAFDVLGVASLVGAVLGTAGVVGLAIGFAFQDIIENYLAGALLSVQQPFDVNDLVEISGREGRVVRLTARELVLLSAEGNHIRLPNATVFKSTMTNYTRNPLRCFSFEIGVGVDEDLTEVARIGVETLGALNGVLSEPKPYARAQTVGDSSVTVRFHGWVDQQEVDILKVRSEALRLVKDALDEANVDMPEPTYRLLLWQQDEPIVSGTTAASATTAAEEAPTVDVAPDGELEAQVEEDLTHSDEENFLGRSEG